MWTAAATDRCMTLSGLHQRVIGKALDYVAWTAARLCDCLLYTSPSPRD